MDRRINTDDLDEELPIARMNFNDRTVSASSIDNEGDFDSAVEQNSLNSHDIVQIDEEPPEEEDVDEESNAENGNDEIEVIPEDIEQSPQEPVEFEDYLVGLRKLEAQGLTDIGNLAHWKVSSFKLGCGVAQLREDNPDTFWQSDSTQPHAITIHFSKKVSLKQISIYTDFNLDESYTPSNIMVLAGHGLHDLNEVATLNMREPRGWNHIKFNNLRDDGLLKCFFVKLLIIANHQNGKDTHIRSVKTFSLSNSDSFSMGKSPSSFKKQARRLFGNDPPVNPEPLTLPFSSIKFISESSIR